MDRALDSPGAAGLRRRLDRRWTWRIASVLAALGSYYLSEWLSLRVAWQAALVAGLELIGDEAQAIWTPSGPGLWLAGERFAITRNCTYLDMLLVLSPLHWRFGVALRANLLRLAVLALGLAAFNQLRIMIAIHLHAVEGVSWRAAHFWPDVLVHVAWITVAALFAMRADNGDRGSRLVASCRPGGVARELASLGETTPQNRCAGVLIRTDLCGYTWDSRREVEDDHQGPEVGQQSGASPEQGGAH